MSENLSLFGWPLSEPREAAGRPEHVPTGENRIKVMMLLATGRTNAEIGKALGLSQPTLRKHYLQQLDQRKVARLQLDATRWAVLYSRMLEGDVGANKELGKMLEKHDLVELSDKVMARGEQVGKAAKPAKPGKKEQRLQAAGEVAGIFAVPEPPKVH